MIEHLPTLLALAFPVLVLIAALTDVTSFTIPNWICLALLAVFPAAALANGLPLMDIALHLGVGIAVLIVGMALYGLGWLGGGDVKLAAAAALWLGWPGAANFLLVSVLAGGLLAIALLSLRSAPLRPLVLLGPPWFARLAEPGHGIPYGLALAPGALVAFLQSPFAAASPLA